MINKNRIQVSLSDENLDRLNKVHNTFGVTKSAQIQSLIAKYLDKEFPNIEKELIIESK